MAIRSSNAALVPAPPLAELRGDLLRRLNLMNEAFETEFDELLELATVICAKPLGAVTLLDEETQLMKARVGFKGARTMPVRESICQYTVRGTHLLMVEDTLQDARFADNKTLQEGDGIRFYAGMPLVSTSGMAVGALCVMDTEPATLTLQQQRTLEILGRQLSNQIQLRERAAALTAALAENERARGMFNTILDNVPMEIYLKDAEGHLMFYNRKMAARFNIDMEEWIGKTSTELWGTETGADIAREEEYAFRHGGRPHESFLELPESQKTGQTTYWRTTKVACEGLHGEKVMACVAVDMTDQMAREAEVQRMQDELEEANRKLSSLALTDALTGLWNRRAFDSRLETTVIGSQRSKQSMALLMIDVDNFKSVNDRFGHPYGDTVLRNVAKILTRSKRAEDVACRFGGEEFAILMPGSNIEGAKQLAQRVLDAMHAFAWEKEPITLSMGLAMCSLTCSSDELVDDADEALYTAK